MKITFAFTEKQDDKKTVKMDFSLKFIETQSWAGPAKPCFRA
jgi:hypothetical protein